LVARFYRTPGSLLTLRSSGDFDYDGRAGIWDFASLAANFDQALSGEPARAADVPEPVSRVAVSAVAPFIPARRK
jgi:hypothetical protein